MDQSSQQKLDEMLVNNNKKRRDHDNNNSGSHNTKRKSSITLKEVSRTKSGFDLDLAIKGPRILFNIHIVGVQQRKSSMHEDIDRAR